MAFDAFTIAALSNELKQAKGAIVERIYQPTKTEIILHLRLQDQRKRLLISTHPSLFRIHYTQKHYVNPENPSSFCMLLRKHLKGGKIENIEQPALERILYLKVANLDLTGRVRTKTLITELMGRHSNLILVDGEPADKPLILGALKIISPLISRQRTIIPGDCYKPPPAQDKFNPLNVDFLTFKNFIVKSEAQGIKTVKALVNNLQGISPVMACELVNRASRRLNDRSYLCCPAETLWQELQKFLDHYRHELWEPTAIFDKQTNQCLSFAPAPLTHDPHQQPVSFKSINELLHTYYLEREENEIKKQLSQMLLNKLNHIVTRIRKKEYLQKNELAEAKSADRYRLWGELLLANLSQITKGTAEVTLPDFYREGLKVTIPLNPQVTASVNAQRYFKKYRKAKKSQDQILSQLQQTQNELAYLESVHYTMENADLQDLLEIKKELLEAGYLKRGPRKTRDKRHDPPLSPRCFLSGDGYPIFVGRNNRQNDLLTFKMAHKQDTWLHVKDLPGSHVIIRGQAPPSTTLEDAAMLAAFFSKGAGSANLPVDYTQVRHVRKLPGAKPGMVKYDHHRTLFVTPSQERIKSLQAQGS